MFRFWLIIILLSPLSAEYTLRIKQDTPSITAFNLERSMNRNLPFNTKINFPWESSKNSFHLFPNQSYWYKISIYNDSNSDINRIIYLTESNIINTEFYVIKQQKIVKKFTHDTIQKSNPEIQSNHPTFNIELTPHERYEVYIRLQNPFPAYQEIWILTPLDFAKYDKYSSILYTGYFIASFGTFFYAFLVAILFKNKRFFLYALYVISTLIWVLTDAGYICLFFSFEIALYLSSIIPISYIILIELSKNILPLETTSPIFEKVLTLIQVILLCLFILMFIDQSFGMLLLFYLGIVGIILSILFVTILLFRPIEKLSKVFLLAIFPMLFAIFIYLLASLNFITPHFLYQYFNLLGFFIELVGFFIILLIQMVDFKHKKEHYGTQLSHFKSNYFNILEDNVKKNTTNATLETELLIKETLLNETHHRVKNNLQLIISILSMQTYSESETSYSLREAISRIQSIASIHEMLYHYSSPSTLQLKNYLENLIEYFSKTYSVTEKELLISLSVSEYSINIQYGLYLGILITELLTNSIKHNNSNAVIIQVKLRIHKNMICLYVKDNGSGIMLENLSSKQTLGLNLIRSLISYFPHSTYKFKSNRGTIFLLSCQLPT